LRTFQDAFNYIGAEIVGMVYGSADNAGDILNHQNVVADAKLLGEKIGSME